LDFGALAGREAEIRAAPAGSECFEDGCAGVVIGAGDAAGGSRESDISERLSATEGGERSLEKDERLRARSSGLLSDSELGDESKNKERSKNKEQSKARDAHGTSSGQGVRVVYVARSRSQVKKLLR
jgi:hypothetical protein